MCLEKIKEINKYMIQYTQKITLAKLFLKIIIFKNI